MTQAVIDWAPACALEAAFAYRGTYPARRDAFGPVLSSVLDAGRAVPALDYQAIRLRRMDLRGRFAHLLRAIDALLVPVQPFAPLTLSEVSTLGGQPALILKLQRYTAPFDLTRYMDSPCIASRIFASGFRVGLRTIYPASGCLRRGGP